MQEYFQSAPVFEVPEDSTGGVLRHTIVADGAAVTGLDNATGSLFFHARTKGGTAVVTNGAASWATDGSDAVIDFTLTSALVENGPRDLVCEWEVQDLAGVSGQNLVTYPFILRVLQRAKVV